jgi:hypothetical protein
MLAFIAEIEFSNKYTSLCTENPIQKKKTLHFESARKFIENPRLRMEDCGLSMNLVKF